MGKSFMEQYKEKLRTADEAVKVVKSGDWVEYGEFMMQAKDLDAALARRKDELKDVKIRVVTCTMMPEVVKVDPEREHFIFNDWHFSGVTRGLQGKDLCNYIPLTYHEAGHFIEDFAHIDVAFMPVGPMDEHGFFNIGTSNSISAYVRDKAIIKIAEVNTSTPKCLGGLKEAIHISEFDYIVESQTNPKLLQLGELPVTDVDRKIAALVLEQMEDGSCIQLGIGAMPNTVGSMIADSDLKDLGVHTEMLVDAYVDMYNAGRINNKRKNIDKGKMVYTFAMGSEKLYNFMNNNPICASYPVGYTNDPCVIGQNDKVIGINNAIEVDLYGQVASESSGFKHISGTGGQFDFIMGSYRSKGGKGFICLSSTTTLKDGSLVSRIRPNLSPGTIVTVPRSCAYYVCTEYGMTILKAKSTWERAEALINIAHPDFRDDLVKEAQKQNLWTKTCKINA